MHISDTALECSQRCIQLASKCTDEEIAVELNALAVQLMVAVARNAELIIDPSMEIAPEARLVETAYNSDRHNRSLVEVAQWSSALIG